MLFATNLLLKGINPLCLDQMPLSTNMYGIFYPLAAYPAAKIWGPTFLVHRAIAGISILLSCMFMVLFLKNKGVQLKYSCSAGLFLYLLWLFRATPVSKPDGIGLLFFLLSAFLPSMLRYTNRSLLLSVFCGVIAFYTKPYFVLAIPYVGTYMFLFVSKKKAVYYTLFSLFCGLASAFLLDLICDVYFANTFFINKNDATSNLAYAMRQFKWFAFVHCGIVALSFLSIPAIGKYFRGFKNARICIRGFNRPLVTVPFSYSFYSSVLSAALVYFYLGRHEGSFMRYQFQIMSPFLVIFCFRVFTDAKTILATNFFYRKYASFIASLCIVLSLALTYRFLHYDFTTSFFSGGFAKKSYNVERLMENWKNMECSLSPYQNILNSPLLVSLQLNTGKPVYDTGLTGGFGSCSYPENDILKAFFPPNESLKAKWETYLENIRIAIAKQEFDAIALTNNPTPLNPKELIEKHYAKARTFTVYLFHCSQNFQLELWLPKKNKSKL